MSALRLTRCSKIKLVQTEGVIELPSRVFSSVKLLELHFRKTHHSLPLSVLDKKIMFVYPKCY